MQEIELAIAKDDSPMGQIAQKLLWENQKLQHDLDDPRYQYCGRATRAAILCRDATIEKLQKQIDALKETVIYD